MSPIKWIKNKHSRFMRIDCPHGQVPFRYTQTHYFDGRLSMFYSQVYYMYTPQIVYMNGLYYTRRNGPDMQLVPSIYNNIHMPPSKTRSTDALRSATLSSAFAWVYTSASVCVCICMCVFEITEAASAHGHRHTAPNIFVVCKTCAAVIFAKKNTLRLRATCTSI